MAFSWFENVKASRKLTIFATPNVTGAWKTVFDDAVKEFNRLSRDAGLGIRLDDTGTTKPDPTSWNKGANVQFDVAAGSVHEETLIAGNGKLISEFTETIDGKALHGRTLVPRFVDDKGVARIFRAYIYVPATPMFTVGHTGSQFDREAGNGVKLFIAVHEMLHACGLDDSDHSTSIDPDFFVGQPQPTPGATASQDKLQVRFEPRLNLPFDPPKDPLLLAGTTARKIKSVW